MQRDPKNNHYRKKNDFYFQISTGYTNREIYNLGESNIERQMNQQPLQLLPLL